MTRNLSFLVAICLASAVLAEEQHPRMFITPDRLAAMRKQAAVKDSYHQQIVLLLKSRVENADFKAAYGDAGYAPGYKAVEAAFLSALAEAPEDKTRYAEIAHKTFAAWTSTGSATLGKSMESRCLALTYDWAWPAWNEAQRAAMRKRVDSCLGALKKISHGNLSGDRSSNFVGVIRGAELLLVLASGEDVKAERAKFLINELKQYMDHFGDLGTTQEGPGYTEYPAPFAFGAAYAAKELGDSTVQDAAARHAFWKLAMYARACGDSRSLMWGVGGGDDYSEGWSSQLFLLCPQDQVPYYLWWYDRHHGLLSPEKRSHRFDSDRHGSVWAMIYYPTGVAAKDPTGVYPTAIADSHGYIFFRNRWKDASDILACIIAQSHKSQKGWNQPEQLAIGLLAQGNRFIGGPAKETSADAYSSLLVDGKYSYANATERMGKVIAFEPSKNGGYTIVQGGQMYEKLGVADTQRHMLVDFSAPAESTAWISTLDRIKSKTEHNYTWQANIGSPKGNDGITVDIATEAGRPVLVMKGRDKGYLKGWVMHPADAKIKGGKGAEPLGIDARGADVDLWVVMFVGAGEPPVAKIEGEGLNAVLSAGGRNIRFDESAGRIGAK